MLPRTVLARRLPRPSALIVHLHHLRPQSTASVAFSQPAQTSPPPAPTPRPSPVPHNPPPTSKPAQNAAPPPGKPRHPKSWLTKKLEANPAAKSAFLKMMGMLGYGSAKQVAGRRAFLMYERLCVVRPDEDRMFWQEECHLPPTFQSWFTVVNLHVWLLTVRLRALPPPHGMNHIQALIDHFFLDIEDRVRAVLQPASPASSVPTTPYSQGPYTPTTEFYTIANADAQTEKRARAPERLVTTQMKIFREQWAGMGLSFDVGLLRGDAEMAGAIWRNFLGARGARGIVYPSAGEEKPFFRRTVNLAGGEVEKVRGPLEAEEARDDGSGVHDYAPTEVDKYVAYPELMAALVAYIRRELMRLERIPDAQILGPGVVGRDGEGVRDLRFGRVREGGVLRP
ncbi:hypothetical protein BKA93DRAFT_789622 [Sparassis latifolia]